MGEADGGKGDSVDGSHETELCEQGKSHNENSQENSADNRKWDSSPVKDSNDGSEVVQRNINDSKRIERKAESKEKYSSDGQKDLHSKRDDSHDGERRVRKFSGDDSSPERKRDRSRSRRSDSKRKHVDESRERRSVSKDRDYRSQDRNRRRDSSTRDRRRRYSSRDRSRGYSRRRSRSRLRRSKSRSRRSRSRSRRSRSRGSSNRQAKLFVGNLSFDTDVETLDRIFSKYGRLVDIYIPRPNPRDETRGRPSVRSKGYGFVTYERSEDAEDALRDWDNRELDGRVIAVEYSKPRRPQPRYRSRSRGYSERGYRRGRSRSRSRRYY